MQFIRKMRKYFNIFRRFKLLYGNNYYFFVKVQLVQSFKNTCTKTKILHIILDSV